MRQSLERSFQEQTVPLKTWVLEVHPGENEQAFLHSLALRPHAATDAVDGLVEETSDAHLHILRFPRSEVAFYVDRLEDRFWSFHTWNKMGEASPILRELVGRRRDIDWTWLPSEHLRWALTRGHPQGAQVDFQGAPFIPEDQRARRLHLQVGGAGVDEFLRAVGSNPDWVRTLALQKVETLVQDEEFGSTQEAVGRKGCFAAKGTSFALHQEFVRLTIRRYRQLVEAIESRMLRWSGDPDHGLQLEGNAISLSFSKPLPDVELFLGSLLSSREPFRLWGIPEEGPNGFWQVEAVDLHVGQSLRMQVCDRWIRLLLQQGSCGNTVARLVANLQHTVDAQIRFVDPELQATLDVEAA